MVSNLSASPEILGEGVSWLNQTQYLTGSLS